MHRLHGAVPAPHIAGQPGVSRGIDEPGPDRLSGREPSRTGRRAIARKAAREQGPDRLACQNAREPFGRRKGDPTRKLVRGGKPMPQNLPAQRLEPDRVIARCEILAGRQGFAGEAAGVEAPGARVPHGERQREDAAFPGRMEDRLVRLRPDGAEPMQAAEVMTAVQAETPWSRARGSPVPIMASRVTSAASSASSRPSVPSGRIGRTM